MSAWRADPRDRDPEIRKERVKLRANALNALGVASVIGALIAPFVDPSRALDVSRLALGGALGSALIFAAYTLLRYMKAKG
jgi:hypothetical protein